MRRLKALLIFAALAALAAPVPAAAQTATIYGSLGNFDVVNNTGHPAHGFEIELEGVQVADIPYTFSAQRYGQAEIVPSPLGVYIRWKSPVGGSTFAQTTIAHTPGAPFAGTCYMWYASTYDAAGCEHFGVSLAANVTKGTYRWLIEDPQTPGALIPLDPPMPVATPYYYIAPPVAAQPPVVVMEVQAPEPPEVPGLYGDAQWIKIFVQQFPREVTLDELVTDNPLVVPMDPGQLEVNWDIIQSEPAAGNQRRQRKQTRSGLAPTTRSVVRRIELYDFTGAYDPLTHEAICADLLCNAPAADGELGDFISAQMTAVNVQADYLTVTKVGNGTVQSADKIISCGSKCTSPYMNGTAVTLTAKAGSGTTFAGWTGGCTGVGTCTVNIAGGVGVTATFTATPATGGGGAAGGGGGATGGGAAGGTTPAAFTLSVSGGKGTITSNVGGIDCGKACSAKLPQGTAVTLTATPAAGATFTGWSGACTGTAATCTVTLTKDAKVQASFK